MVKTAAQLIDQYTNSHTSGLQDRVRGREDNGTPKQERQTSTQTDGIPHQMARV